MNAEAAEYLTTKQVAELLGVSSQRVLQLAHRIPHKRVGPGGMRLFDPAGVEAFIETRKVAAA